MSIVDAGKEQIELSSEELVKLQGLTEADLDVKVVDVDHVDVIFHKQMITKLQNDLAVAQSAVAKNASLQVALRAALNRMTELEATVKALQ